MAKPDYNVATPIPYGRDKTYWHNVGKAWDTKGGRICVVLNSYPLPDSEGQVRMFLFEEEDNRKSSREERPHRSTGDEIDDEVPF